MKHILLFVACLVATCPSVAAEPANVQVHCPAVAFDDHDDRGRDVPMPPRPVVLMVVAKVGETSPTLHDSKPRRDGSLAVEGAVTTLNVERVLFGSPPGPVVKVRGEYGARLPADAQETSYIYGLVLSKHEGRIEYSFNGYYASNRRYTLDEEPYAQALAQARLDLLTLSAHAIVVARPLPLNPQDDARELLVDRVLAGDANPGDRLTVNAKYRQPVPVPGEGPFLYFLRDPKKVETRWSLETEGLVREALARRDHHPVRERIRWDGETEQRQEIVLAGPRSAAIEMLGSTRETFEILAARRLLSDGAESEAEVVAAIEETLWADADDKRRFTRQANLIRLLGILEEHRTDGQVARLIASIFDKAEAGTPFPAATLPTDVDTRVAHATHTPFPFTSNHSLGWLLLSLEEEDLAKHFGSRLLKLRDAKQPGWHEEAQLVIDHCHVEDFLELAELAQTQVAVEPKRWSLNEAASDEASRIVAIDFADENTLRTRDQRGAITRWNTSDGARLPSSADDARTGPKAIDLRSRSLEHQFLDEAGQTWQFAGQGGGKFERYTSFDVRVTVRGKQPPSESADELGPFTTSRGTIQPRWGQFRWCGLVPGGQYLHVGAQVFSRDDLSPVSAVNFSGDLDQMAFNRDGKHYVLVTSEAAWDPTELGFDVVRRRVLSQQVRVHDTATGRTLWTISPEHAVSRVAFSPDGRQLAIILESKTCEIWPLPTDR